MPTPQVEKLYYDTLRRIAKEYMTPEQLRRRAGQYGLSYLEALEMSYDNIQVFAADAIRGKRRPKDFGAGKPKKGASNAQSVAPDATPAPDTKTCA